jgi:hypothetical protein
MFFDDTTATQAFTVSDDIFDSSWRVHSTGIRAGLIAQTLDKTRDKRVEHPCVAFIVNFGKKSFKDILILFMPIFTSGLFAWLSLLMNLSNHVGRFSLAISAVTALIGYRFVIEQVSPHVGYFTILDKFYLFFLGFGFAIFVFHLLLTSFWHFIDKKLADAEAVDSEQVAAEFGLITPEFVKKLVHSVFTISSLLMYVLTLYFLFY